MPMTPRHREHASSGEATQDAERTARPKPVGRPTGDPSTIMNVRLPLPLLAQLDRYLDRLEWQTGLKANRGMITRRALELFLATHTADDPPSVTA
jgi:hypothetical protein